MEAGLSPCLSWGQKCGSTCPPSSPPEHHTQTPDGVPCSHGEGLTPLRPPQLVGLRLHRGPAASSLKQGRVQKPERVCPPGKLWLGFME